MKSLQDKYAPNSKCFGCGPKNSLGLKIKSYVDKENSHMIICRWTPSYYHQAFDNILNGGICGSILDCHSNWTAAYFLMKHNCLNSTPCTVTADYHVKLKKPTPVNTELLLQAKVLGIENNQAKIEANLIADNKITATCLGNFVAVKQGHPAYHRW